MRWLVVCAAACMAGCRVRAQPIQCSEDHQCSSGSYCAPELHFCLACLSCQSLKREPPPVASTCVRYVTECGPCLQGLVAASDGGDGCTAPADAGLPAHLWAIIGICLLLFVVFVIAVLVYILRHKDTFKFTSATSVETQRAPPLPAPPTAPPPYDGRFEPVRPSSPPHPGTAESEAPLVKRAGSTHAGGDGVARGARESASRQAARVFNNPNYVRGPHLPPSPPTYDEAFSDGSDQEAGFVPPPDEDTMESFWTPDDTAAGAPLNEAASTSVPEASALARRPERSELAPPAKVHCVREAQDTNNNRGGESSSARAPPAASMPALVINVLNVNTVHQLNDLTL